MKKELFKSRFMIAALFVSLIGFYGTQIPIYKYTFLVINVMSAIILVKRINKAYE